MPVTWSTRPTTSTYPLTSIFTAPDWCSSNLYTYHPLPITGPWPSYFLRAQKRNDGHGFATKYEDCYPPGFATIAALPNLPDLQTFTQFWNVITATTEANYGAFSPGVCPSGWRSWLATQPSTTEGSDPAIWYMCCPLYASVTTYIGFDVG